MAVSAGALLAAFAWTATSTTQSVLAVRSAVERGAVIAPGRRDDRPGQRRPGAGPCSGVAGLGGGRPRAATDLAAGTLLTREQVSDTVLPPAGMSIVGVGLPSAQLPGEPLLVGDRVRVVATPVPPVRSPRASR